MSLRIGFDLDGVLADMESELVRQAAVLFGEAMVHRLRDQTADGTTQAGASATPDDPGEDRSSAAASDNTPPLLKLRMTPRQQRRLWRHVESIENFWEALAEIEPGTVERLSALAIERRWEIIFLTNRPESAGGTCQAQSQRWLESKGFTLPSVFVVRGSRGRVAAALDLDIVIDDRPQNCLDVVIDSKAKAILVWRDDEKHLPAATRRLGVGVVKSVGECLDILVAVDTPGGERASLIDRVRRLLGFKEAANA